jgi:colicin import membrane protein
MPGFMLEHRRPLAAAVVLHLLVFGVIVATAWRWTSTRPALPMAIEGVVVDERALARQATNTRQPAEARPEPTPPPQAREETPPAPDTTAEQARELEQQERAAQEKARQAAAEAEQRRAAEAAERTAAEAAQRKAAEEAQRKAAVEEAERKAQVEKTARETAQQREREAELRRRLAAEEEEGAALATSGVLDEYRAALVSAIERAWIRPASAKPGLLCTLNVSQAPGGTVLDVRIGSCNGDAAVQESIVNAVFRASPLPPPRDPRAFQRHLEIVFQPTE